MGTSNGNEAPMLEALQKTKWILLQERLSILDLIRRTDEAKRHKMKKQMITNWEGPIHTGELQVAFHDGRAHVYSLSKRRIYYIKMERHSEQSCSLSYIEMASTDESLSVCHLKRQINSLSQDIETLKGLLVKPVIYNLYDEEGRFLSRSFVMAEELKEFLLQKPPGSRNRDRMKKKKSEPLRS